MSDWKSRATPVQSDWKSRATSVQPEVQPQAQPSPEAFVEQMPEESREQLANQQNVMGPLRPVQTYSERFANVLTAGHYPEIKAGVDVATDRLSKFLSPDSDLEKQGFKIQQPSDPSLEQHAEANRMRMLARQEQDPIASVAGAGMGIIAGAKTMPSLAPFKNTVNTGKAMRAVKTGSNLALGGAAYGALENPTDRGVEDSVRERMQQAKTGAVLGPVVGLGLHGLIKGSGVVADKAKSAGKWALSKVGGVSTDKLDQYISDPDLLNKAPTMEALKGQIDETVGKLTAAIDDQSMTVAQATANLKQFETEVADQLRQSNIDAADAAKLARQMLADARNKAVASTSEEVAQGVAELRGQVSQGSKESFDIIEKEGLRVQPRQIIGAIKKHMDAERIDGVHLDDVQKEIGPVLAQLEALPETLSPSGSKQIIQYLQSLVNWKNPQTGMGISGAGQRILKQAQGEINEALRYGGRTVDPEKTAPIMTKYGQKMQEVAADTRLVTEAEKRLGTPGKAAGVLGSIGRPANADKEEVLRNLEQRMGKNYASQVDQRQLPEYQQALNAVKHQRATRKAKVVDAVRGSPQSDAVDEAKIELQRRQAPLESVSKFKSPTSSESAIRQAMHSDKNIETKAQLTNLSKLSGQDFNREVEKLAFSENWAKGKGSNWWLGIGGALGWKMGGGVGAAAGVGAGRAIKEMQQRFGPQATKKVLDWSLSLQNKPSVQMIKKIPGIPPEMHNYLINQLTPDASKDKLRALLGGKE